MARLYYPRAAASLVAGDEAPAKEYLEKVAKLIPSEIVAVYLAGVGIIPAIANASVQAYVFWLFLALCTLMTPVYLYRFMRDRTKPKSISRRHALISTAAFLFWAYAVSAGVLPSGWHDGAISSLLLLTFSLVSGAIPLDP